MKTALLAIVLLSGCASIPGLEMTDAERVACEQHGCTVWTRAELEQLVRVAMQRGYLAGRKSL
jgi:uncharacterized protein YcfL